MVTVGRGILDPAVGEFFDALRSYDVARALKPLADDVDFSSPWHGRATGKAAVEAILKPWLTDPVKRPTLTIIDVSGDGAITHLKVSVSGRFGKAPEHVRLSVLCLRHKLHQVTFAPLADNAH